MRHETDATQVRRIPARAAIAAVGLLALVVFTACRRSGPGPIHGWWEDRGPVIPHDTFPADCTLCHSGGDWTTLRDDFAFDHAAETGRALEGAHARAQCLRCHNDRGPVQIFSARGCAGCHEDVHLAQLGAICTDCHGESNWRPQGMIEEHARTRFPLVGAHAATACWRCHPGAEVGRFTPTDTECATCHADDLARARNPDHLAQGWTQECNRCHIPTTWTGGGFDHGFPINSGAHNNLDCAECHIQPNNFMVFTCTDCHAHEKNDMDDEHDDERNYVYDTPACYACHPNGKE